MRRIAKLLMILLITPITCMAHAKNNGFPLYEKHSNEIVREFAKEMKREYGMVCTGDGGRMPHDVEELSVHLLSYQRATIEKARELEVKATEKLLQLINGHEKIRPYLREYPFKADRAEVSISFEKPNGASYADGSVVYVFQVRNKIIYDREDPIWDRLVTIQEEPYEEAFAKVREAQPDPGKEKSRSFLRKVFPFIKTRSAEEPPPPFLKVAEEIFQRFAKEILEEYGIVSWDRGGSLVHDVEEMAIKVIAHQRAEVDEARELEVKATEKFLKLINENKKIRPWLREYPFKANRASVGIAFRKEDNETYQEGGLTFVYQVNGKIFYAVEAEYTADVKIVAEEPYEEALKKTIAKLDATF